MNRHPLVFVLALLSCLASSSGAMAQPSADGDKYQAGRAIVADIDKIVTPNGIQETFEATLGGARQVVNVRGADRDNPILLFVHGGPGAVEMPIAWSFQRPWEDFFTVVQWDQRGAGRSYELDDPAALAPTLTLERYRDDAIELIELLRQKYGKRKIILLGHSWGSLLGLSVAAKRPDLLYAYVGMGQMIDVRENERVGMAWTLAQARARGNIQAVAEIERLSPYPDAGPFTIDAADGWRKWAIPYGAIAAGRADANFYLRAPHLSPEYTTADLKAWDDGSLFTVTTLWPRLADKSLAAVDHIGTPVIMLLGRQDYMTPSSIAGGLDGPAENAQENHLVRAFGAPADDRGTGPCIAGPHRHGPSARARSLSHSEPARAHRAHRGNTRFLFFLIARAMPLLIAARPDARVRRHRALLGGNGLGFACNLGGGGDRCLLLLAGDDASRWSDRFYRCRLRLRPSQRRQAQEGYCAEDLEGNLKGHETAPERLDMSSGA